MDSGESDHEEVPERKPGGVDERRRATEATSSRNGVVDRVSGIDLDDVVVLSADPSDADLMDVDGEKIKNREKGKEKEVVAISDDDDSDESMFESTEYRFSAPASVIEALLSMRGKKPEMEEGNNSDRSMSGSDWSGDDVAGVLPGTEGPGGMRFRNDQEAEQRAGPERIQDDNEADALSLALARAYRDERQEWLAAYKHKAVVRFAKEVHDEARLANFTEEAVAEVGNFVGPFAEAFGKIKDMIDRLRARGEAMIRWLPVDGQNHCYVPSLFDLSLDVLAKNCEAIVSLEKVPCEIRNKLASVLCDCRKMDVNFMRLLVAGSPLEICVKDCSWMTVDNFSEIFQNCNVEKLQLLYLELCGKCMFDYTLSGALARSSNRFNALLTISLKGASGLTDEGLKSLLLLAPCLKSINLSSCTLITADGIHIIAKAYASKLKELYLDECPMIDAMIMLPGLMHLENLEVLSVAGILTVTDEFVGQIAAFCGAKMKHLGLADCGNLTNLSVEVIGANCPNLTFLDLSNLEKLTDYAFQYIANGCQSIQHLKLRRNCFSDEALAAFFEIAGNCLTELSLNYIRKVGPGTAFSIAKYCSVLVSLDLSWCRRITDEMLGLIVDSCRSLKLLKLFGCTQITEVFLKGHSNSIIHIIGLKNMPISSRQSFIRPMEEGPLRYSSHTSHI